MIYVRNSDLHKVRKKSWEGINEGKRRYFIFLIHLDPVQNNNSSNIFDDYGL